eukprot:2097167-Ditylum_brightwellii.AAC.1
MAAENITMIDTGEIPLELGDFAKIAGSKQNKTLVPLPPLSLTQSTLTLPMVILQLLLASSTPSALLIGAPVMHGSM